MQTRLFTRTSLPTVWGGNGIPQASLESIQSFEAAVHVDAPLDSRPFFFWAQLSRCRDATSSSFWGTHFCFADQGLCVRSQMLSLVLRIVWLNVVAAIAKFLPATAACSIALCFARSSHLSSSIVMKLAADIASWWLGGLVAAVMTGRHSKESQTRHLRMQDMCYLMFYHLYEKKESLILLNRFLRRALMTCFCSTLHGMGGG
ncbi:hypothetical protein F2Q70_00014870 [Brassica cretica]|uniref:Uncharacterized protein n=1 Tax=Brassica cretica TaxID=69181 RepID=A0A8S9HW09_BRACR|nr:hypothetical protein F2Q70_00014870 [Brassica cretica]